MTQPRSPSRREFMRLSSMTLISLALGHRPARGNSVLDDFILERLAADRVPGFAAGIVVDGQVVWARGYGWADIACRVPMTADTILNIASVSKTITTTAVMQLQEKGRIDLDRDVNGYLPFRVRNPRYADVPITVRQLLTHHSSIQDGPAYQASYACGDPTISLGDWVRGYLLTGGDFYNATENFHDWAPGTENPPTERRTYSNVGFGLLGYIVETVSGVPFSQFTRERIFAPLGLADTAWHLKEIDVERHAVPYTAVTADLELPDGIESLDSYLPATNLPPGSMDAGSLFPHCLYSFPNYPDGLLRTSVKQLARFLAAYMNGGAVEGARILKQRTVETILSNDHFGRGLGWSATVDKKTGDTRWGHGGGDPGVSTYMGFYAQEGVGLCLLLNSDGIGEGVGSIYKRLHTEARSL